MIALSDCKTQDDVLAGASEAAERDEALRLLFDPTGGPVPYSPLPAWMGERFEPRQ